MSPDILKREVHQMRSGIDRDGVCMRHRDPTMESETALSLGEHRDLARFRGDIEPVPLRIERQDVRIAPDPYMPYDAHGPQVDDEERCVAFVGDEQQTP